jgi:hypothetical protein
MIYDIILSVNISSLLFPLSPKLQKFFCHHKATTIRSAVAKNPYDFIKYSGDYIFIRENIEA